MKILITGNRGFIGGHLQTELEQAGHNVHGIDIKNDPLLEDASNPKNLIDQIQAHKPDLLVHLAAKVGRQFGEDDPLLTVKDNAGMTANVAKVCGEAGVRVIYASTSEVYGDNGEANCDEIDGPWTRPYNIYGLSKLWGETACQLYAPEGFTALRFSMPYGPGLPAGRGRAAIINMLWQAKYWKTIPVHKGAERSWCWIGDTVRAARLAIEQGEGPYNIGRDDQPLSMLRIAQLACQITEAPRSLIHFVDAPANQTVVKRLSTDRIRALGWEPLVDIEEGMQTAYSDWILYLNEDGSHQKEEQSYPAL